MVVSTQFRYSVSKLAAIVLTYYALVFEQITMQMRKERENCFIFVIV